MSFSLWPNSSSAEKRTFQTADGETYPATPSLDFIHTLNDSGLRITRYKDWMEEDLFRPPTNVGSGAQAVVELSKKAGTVIKRTRRLKYTSSNHASCVGRDLAQLTLELRILTSELFRNSELLVKVVGICFEEPVIGLDPLDAGRFHLLLEHSQLGNMATFLRGNAHTVGTEIKVDLLRQVSQALTYLHFYLICHGDLKLQNVLIFYGEDGSFLAKVADFGVSVHPNLNDVHMEAERDVEYPLGTPLLSAPEIRNRNLNEKSVDLAVVVKSDVFSFGLLLWEALKDGQSYFDMAWLQTNRAPQAEVGAEAQMAFLSSLPHNGLLALGEEFLASQQLERRLYEQMKRVFRASLQDDPLQRDSILSTWEMFELSLAHGEDWWTYFEEIKKLSLKPISPHGILASWRASFPRAEVLAHQHLRLPDSFQQRALDELKRCATWLSPIDDLDLLRARAALQVSTCYLISFGTDFDYMETLRWLLMAKTNSNDSSELTPFWVWSLAEDLKSLNACTDSELHEDQLDARPVETRPKDFSTSELCLLNKIQSGVHSAVTQIREIWRGLQSDARISLATHAILITSIGMDLIGHIGGSNGVTTLGLAALLGEDAIVMNMLSDPDAPDNSIRRSIAAHCACIGGHLSLLKCVLGPRVDVSPFGKKNISVLHLLIFMPSDKVAEAANFLLANNASKDVCSKTVSIERTGFNLSGTPIEWAVLARNRAMVAALLPHFKVAEKRVFQHAVSHGYYEIVEDLFSDGALLESLTKQDLPLFVYPSPFVHLIAHGSDGDRAVERTIRLCDGHGLIDYKIMLRRCIHRATTQSCLKALRVLLDLCPAPIIREGFQSDDRKERARSILFSVLTKKTYHEAWRPIIKDTLCYFTVAELDALKLRHSQNTAPGINLIHLAVSEGWTVTVQALLEKGVDPHIKINESTPTSAFEFAVLQGNIEMQTILSSFGGGTTTSSGDPNFILDFFSQGKPRRQGLIGISLADIRDKGDLTRVRVMRAHRLLVMLLITRQVVLLGGPVDREQISKIGLEEWSQIKLQIWSQFQAFVTDESVTASIDTPDDEGVTMLQRATSIFDHEAVKLLLEAGADASIPFPAKVLGDDGEDRTKPLLPFQIALLVSCRVAVVHESDQSVTLEAAERAHFLQRMSRTTCNDIKDWAQRVENSGSNRLLTPGETLAEYVRANALGIAHEFLRWHRLRGDTRFEGITELHLRFYGLDPHAREVYDQKDNPDVHTRASWPGREGKYTVMEMLHLSEDDLRACRSRTLIKLWGTYLSDAMKTQM